MGHQGHEQIYLSLSRKELQGLCKQHDLPANRSNLDLARSLECLFRRKNFSELPSEEASDVPPSPETKTSDRTKSSRVTDNGFGREYITRKNSSKAGSYRRIACLKESVGQEKRDTRTINRLENVSQVNCLTLDKALSRAANASGICPASNEGAENAGCSTSAPGTFIEQPLLMSDAQDVVSFSQLVSQKHQMWAGNKILELKNNHERLQNPCGVYSLPFVPYKFKKFDECLPCPSAVTSTNTPAFQFFVESEDGINIFVDLCSTPSDWVKSLKDDVCISQDSYNGKPLALCHEIRHLGDLNKNLRTQPTDNVERNLLPRGSGGNTQCSNSSLNFTGEFYNPMNILTNNDNSRSSGLTSNVVPVELCGHLDAFSQAFCPTTAINSFALKNVNTSSHNGFLSKSSCHSQDNLETDRLRLRLIGQQENPTMEGRSDCSQSVGLLGHMSESASVSASVKSSFSLSSERCVVSRSCTTCNHDYYDRCRQISPESSSKEVKMLEFGESDKAKSSAYHAPAQEVLICSVSNMELDERESESHVLEQHVDAKPEDSTPDVPALASDDTLEPCAFLREKLDSQHVHSTKLLNSCKRCHISEQHEDLQNKRKNKIGAATNFRSMKIHVKDSNCGALSHPRRSTRLMSK